MRQVNTSFKPKTNIFYFSLSIFFSFYLFFINISPISAQSPLTFDSLYSFKTVRNLQLSPNEKWLLYLTRKTDSKTSKSTPQIWLMDLFGKNKNKFLRQNNQYGIYVGLNMGKNLLLLQSQRIIHKYLHIQFSQRKLNRLLIINMESVILSGLQLETDWPSLLKYIQKIIPKIFLLKRRKN